MKTIFTCFFILTLNFSFAQTNFVVNEGSNTSDEVFYSAAQISGGNFIGLGYSTANDPNKDIFMVEVDRSGALVWTKTISTNGIDEGFSIMSLGNKGFAICGTLNNKMAILKFDTSGNLQWKKQYIEGKASSARKLLQTNDGGYLIGGGTSQDKFFTTPQCYLVKTDASGNVEWAKKYFTSSNYNIINDLRQTKDGNYVFLSLNRSSNDSTYIVKIDTTGNLKWATSFADPTSRTVGASILPTVDSGYIVAGNRYNLSSNGFVLKLNGKGKKLWGRTTNSDGTADISFRSIVNGSNGGYAIVGSGSVADSNFNYAVNIDDGGNLVWSKTDRKANKDTLSSIYSVINTKEGGYLSTGSALDNSGSLQGMLMKLDFEFVTCKPSTGTYGSLADYGILTSATTTFTKNKPDTATDAITIIKANSHKLVCSVLPLNLLSFNAMLQKRSVELQWQTASEQNTSYFSAEKSNDGRVFTAFQQIAAAGNSNTILNYSTYDDEPFAGKSWYRLKLVDKDGNYTYSNAVMVSNVIQNAISVNPNPVSSMLNLNIQSLAATNATIQIVDINGKLLLQTTRVVSFGFNTFPFDVSKYPAGVYSVRIIQDNNSQNFKWVKQ